MHDLDIEFSDEEWWSLFPNLLKLVKPSKLRIFQYRVLTRTLTTNVRCNKWAKEISLFTIIVLKQFIYTCKCKGEKPLFTAYVAKLSD